MRPKPQLLIFDVNETLLNLSPLESRINELLGSKHAFGDWFSQLIQFAMVETLSGGYSDFGEIGAATLKMTAEKYAVSVSEEDITSTLKIIKKLEPHPEVKHVLEKLKAEGYTLVTLTNGGHKTLNQQMKYSGLGNLFDALYSVEAVKKFKPHPSTYLHVLKKEQVEAKDAMLVAAHAWDIVGAEHAGLQTAFIARPNKFMYPKSERPTLVCSDFGELYHKLVAEA